MKELSNKFSSPAKRLLQFIDNQGITKYEFHKKIGVSNGFLDKAKEIRSDNIRKILDKYPIISPVWLLTGKGEMLLKDENTALVKEKEPSQVEGLKEKIAFLEKAIKDKDKIIDLQEYKIEKYRLKIEKLKQKVKQLNELLEKKNAYSKSVGAGTSLSAKPPADKSSVITGKKNIENPQRPRKSS